MTTSHRWKRTAVALALAAWVCPATGFSQDECTIPASAAATRPDSEAGPTIVRVGIYVIDLTHIEEVEKTFTADVNLTLSWRDPRLSATALGRSLAGCAVTLAEIWDPAVSLVNLREVDRIEEPFLSVDESGGVFYRERFYGRFTARLDLRDFPFDRQVLPITVVVRNLPTDVALVPDSSRLGMVDQPSVSGWSLRLGEVSEQPFRVPGLGVTLSRLEQRLLARRESGFYLLKLLLPLGIVVLMASVVFWVDPIAYPRQLGYSFTSILTLIAYHFSQTFSMPKISYLTRFDSFLTGASLLVFMAAIETVVAGSLAHGGNVETARHLNLWSRWIYLLAVLVVGVVTLAV